MKHHRVDKKIDAAFAREDWEGARKLILPELEKQPEDHWLLARLSTTYYEQREYAKALEHIEKAYRIRRQCPLVLWDFAGTLDAIGRPSEALKLYARLIGMGPRTVGSTRPCGEGLEWAISLLNDCVFRGAVCWEHLQKYDVAGRWYLAFLELRRVWSEGLYNHKDALKRIEKLPMNLPELEKSISSLEAKVWKGQANDAHRAEEVWTNMRGRLEASAA